LTTFSLAQEVVISNGLTLKVGDTIQVGASSASIVFQHIRALYSQEYSIYDLVSTDKNLSFHKCIVTSIDVTNPDIKQAFKDKSKNRIISFSISDNTSNRKGIRYRPYNFYADIENALKSGEIIIKMNEAPTADLLNDSLAFLYFAKGIKVSPDSLVEEYLYRYMSELYTKTYNDEFEYQNALNTAKTQLLQNIEQVALGKTYYIYKPLILGNYDFNKGGFPVQEAEKEKEKDKRTFSIIPEIDSHDFDAFFDVIPKFLPLCSIEFVFLNFNDFQFVKVPEQEARTLLKRRKDEDGYIDREVYAIINFTLVKSEIITPKVKKNATQPEGRYDMYGFKNPNNNDPKRLLYGKIERIELYEFKGYKYNWIGTITPRPAVR
jgi:hypothetical protein